MRKRGENSDALADMIAAVPLGPHIDPVKMVIWQRAQLLINCKIQNQSAQIWPLKMVNHRVKPLAICQKLAWPSSARPDGANSANDTAKQLAKSAGELAATGQVAPSETFIGPMPALSADAKMAANIANLRAIRAANLEQRNAEINAKLRVMML